jgi:hypothetical protein
MSHHSKPREQQAAAPGTTLHRCGKERSCAGRIPRCEEIRSRGLGLQAGYPLGEDPQHRTEIGDPRDVVQVLSVDDQPTSYPTLPPVDQGQAHRPDQRRDRGRPRAGVARAASDQLGSTQAMSTATSTAGTVPGRRAAATAHPAVGRRRAAAPRVRAAGRRPPPPPRRAVRRLPQRQSPPRDCATLSSNPSSNQRCVNETSLPIWAPRRYAARTGGFGVTGSQASAAVGLHRRREVRRAGPAPWPRPCPTPESQPYQSRIRR